MTRKAVPVLEVEEMNTEPRSLQAASPVLVLTGLPACGKSYFADWLRDTHGFVAYDTDRLQAVPALIQGAFTRLCGHPTSDNASALLRLLQEGGQPVAWHWGFPPPLWRSVQAFQQAGAVTWWFFGPESEARRRFEARGAGCVADFTRQMGLIHEYRSQLAAMVGVHRLQTLRDDGSFFSVESIWQAIRPRLSNFLVQE